MFGICQDTPHDLCTCMLYYLDVSYLAKYNGPLGRLMEIMLNWTENRVRIQVHYTSVDYFMVISVVNLSVTYIFHYEW